MKNSFTIQHTNGYALTVAEKKDGTLLDENLETLMRVE
jgi:hypothetical protein